MFNSLYNSDDNIFLGAPTGSGKTVCAEFALLRLFSQQPDARAVYVSPRAELVEVQFQEWSQKFGAKLGESLRRLIAELSKCIGLFSVFSRQANASLC